MQLNKNKRKISNLRLLKAKTQRAGNQACLWRRRDCKTESHNAILKVENQKVLPLKFTTSNM